MKLSLRNKFLLPTIILLVIALGASSGISYFQSRDALKEAIDRQLTQLTETNAKVIGWWIGDRRLDVTIWSKEKQFRDALIDAPGIQEARKAANNELKILKDAYHYYEDICVANPKGGLVSASNLKIIGKISVADRGYFKKAMTGQLVISEVTVSKATKNPIFVIAGPIRHQGKILGVFFGVVDLARFSSEFIDPIKIGKTGYAFMYDSAGQVIAHPDKKNILNLKMQDTDFGRRMLSQKKGLLRYVWQSVEKIAALSPEPTTGWTVVVGSGTADLMAPAIRLGYINLIISVIAVLVGVLVIFLTARSVVNPIIRLIGGLSNGSDRVSTAADEISGSSQSLSEGTSEQAASLEETASSLEEMASMVKSNADNASEADAITRETSQVVSSVNEDMDEMAEAMKQIAEVGGEISKIVKSIDEIAFQTNLLALNAAVEAARAGEAGMGFAVVADEVRALAMRAADAAKNTQELVETTVNRIEQGAGLVDKTKEGFGQVANSTGKVAALVSEIAAASREQAQGIEQVNQAMTQMDQVVQQNAANAEETASASQEMRTQADRMHGQVGELHALVTGGADQTAGAKPRTRSAGTGAKAAPKAGRPVRALSGPAGKAPVGRKAKEMKPEQIIPFDLRLGFVS